MMGYDELEKICDVKRIEMHEINGWTLPVFISAGGRYIPKMIPTGNCWALHWELKPDTSTKERGGE